MVGIAYYLMILQNQQRNQQQALETRQAQMFLNIYDKSSTIQYNQARTLLMTLEYNNIEEFYNHFIITAENPINENWNALDLMISYYEGLGTMIREGLIPIRYVALLQAGVTRKLWEKFTPLITYMRELLEQPRIASEWEYLYNELMKYMEEHPEIAT